MYNITFTDTVFRIFFRSILVSSVGISGFGEINLDKYAYRIRIISPLLAATHKRDDTYFCSEKENTSILN